MGFVHEKGHWLEGRVGIDIASLPRTILSDAGFDAREPLIVNDARADARFADHPLVREGVRFYAGLPLITQGGLTVGTLCVADYVPRSLTDEQLHVLQALARQVVAQFELRHAAKELSGTAEQLRANQQKLSSIFGAMSDAVIFSEPGGRILEANPAAERMFACTNMELCALNLRDLYDPSDGRLPAAREEFDRTDAFRGELSVRRTGGEIFPAEVAVNRYVDANGQSRTAAVLRDFTERRRTEDALHFAKERYTELVDRINAIVWRANPQTFQFTFVSRAAESLLGYSREEWLAPGFWVSIIHPDDLAVVEECRAAVESRVDHVLTYRIRTSSGLYRSFRDHVHVQQREGGSELFGVMVDVTEMLEAEASARASEEKYRRLIEDAPDGIGVHVNGRFVLANAALAKILGLETSAELVGQTVSRFVHPDYAASVIERQKALSHGESVPVLPEKLVRADGSPIDVEVSAIPTTFGESMAVQVMVRDISERVEAEAKAREAEIKTREAETRFQIISAASNDALWDWSYEHGMTWMNEAYSALFGTAEKSAISVERWLGRVHPDDRARVQEGLEHALLRRAPMWTDEYRFQNPEGAWITILSRCQLRFDENGAPTRLIGGMMDMTELRVAEGQRRDVERLYRIFLENSMLGVYIVQDSRIIYANPKAKEIFGYAGDEFLDIRNVLDTIAPEHREMVKQKILDRLSGATSSVPYTARCVRKNGELFDAEFVGSIAEIGGKKAIIGNFTDVTDRRRSEVALQRSEERLRLLVENVNEIIYSVDAEGRLIWLNSAFERITGFSSEEWIGRPFLELLTPESAETALHHFTGVMERGEAQPMQYALRTQKGRLIEIESSSRAVIVQGEVVGSVGVARDISTRRQLERDLARATRLSGLGQLAASIAHEFNNVLMGIQPFAEVLTKPGQSRENIVTAGGFITQSIERGKNVSLQILRFANPQPPELAPVRVREWLDDVAAEARAVVGASCKVVLQTGEDAGLLGDRSQLTQVMMNLVINARDAMAGGGTITIAASGAQEGGADQVHLVITDEGCGIPANLLNSIFDPLFTTKRTGTGLGLSIAHQIIASHGGRMFAENAPGGGAEFHVLLPAAPLEAAPVTIAARREPSSSHRVLLVEDDEVVAAGLVMLLELEGFAVERLPDGSRVIETYERGRPEVVILDMNLPGASGIEIYAQLRERFGNVCVVFSTGHVGTTAVESEPNVRLLVKPYSVDLLIDAMESLLAWNASRRDDATGMSAQPRETIARNE